MPFKGKPATDDHSLIAENYYGMSDLIGKIVCGYKIVSEVGEGGMGKVYLAESAYLTEYKQQVAVKTLIPNASSERQAALLRDLFTREANIQVQFKHPHIVSVIQFAVEEGRLFLILEYMPGYQHRGRRISNIADMISHETGPVPHKRALKLFIQALDAMSYAHDFKYRWEGDERVGIVHRDIKPANLLVMDSNTIKVSDFGIVKVQQRAPAATRQLTPGTSAYMAPEAILGPQAYDMPELDARSDIYALGVTLYEMLAGRLPFSPDPNTNPDVSLRRKHVNEDPPPPSAYYPAIPKPLDDLVLRALAKRPEERYQSAFDFKQSLLSLDDSLGLGLRNSAGASNYVTNPLLNPTERFAHSTTSTGDTVLDTAADVMANRTYDPAATNLYELQSDTVAALEKRPKGSKNALLVGVLILALASAAALWFFVLHKPRVDGQETGLTPTPIVLPTTIEGMASIPAGSYLMGRNLTEEQKNFSIELKGVKIKIFSYDWPAHEVKVEPFFIDLQEVSNREYAEFIKSGHPAPSSWPGPTPLANTEFQPVTDVTYQDAVEYCAWRSEVRKDGVKYRIPTEEEWEYAARGKDAGKDGSPVNLFPWGDEWAEGNANTLEARLGQPRNVDTYQQSKSPFGVLNLSGNVVEWTSSDFNHYPGSDMKTPRPPNNRGSYQVVRGGGFDYPKEYAMTTTRVWALPTDKGPKLGFRCAADGKR
jgi:serine/threonine protein kinase